MGIESGSPDEGPAHEVDVAAFQMDKFKVTNADFATFVEATGYQPYPGNTQPDPFYGEQFRVIRGAGWFEEAPQVVAYNRNAADPDKTANDDLGFRCAK